MEKLIKKLIDNKITVSNCESCTGGLLAAEFVDISGASDVFMEGIVTYSNEAKIRLGVDKETLIVHGAVSEETALQMANSIRERAGTTLGISTTGIAGPGGGTKEKPVGLVYTAVCAKDGYCECKKLLLGNIENADRENIRHAASCEALGLVIKYLENK